MIMAATATLNTIRFLSVRTSLGVAASSFGSPTTAATEYPASSTECLSSEIPATPGTYSTDARSVARLTLADSTPSAPSSAFSTCITHAAQVIPPIASVVLRVPTPYPASSTAFVSVDNSMSFDLRSSDAFSVARLTDTHSTPPTSSSASET